MFRSVIVLVATLLCIPSSSICQIAVFPYVEHFDTIPDSTIPIGWQTSKNRRPSGDFFASLSSPRSSPHCLLSQNSIVSQSLTSPVFDFSSRVPDRLQFYVARSSTHTSGLLIEGSIDGGMNFSIALSDTIKNPGTTSYLLNTILLPSSLQNQNAVRFRWRIVGGTGGSTATFRIDDVSLTALTSYDMAVNRVSLEPAQPFTIDSLVFTALVKNLAVQNAVGYKVDFYIDLNSNTLAEPNEQFMSVTGPVLPPGDSTTIVVGHSPMKAGDYRVIAVVSIPLDENTSNDTSSTTLTVGYPRGSLLVNEFMYAPVGDEPEWVELFNRSADTVNIKNWRISDINVSSKSLITATDVLIPPLGFCVVAKESAFTSYHPGIRCPVVTASFSALNNTTPDAVVIYDQRISSMDSIPYSPTWGGQGGKSLERVDVDQSSYDPKNWGTSQDSSTSSPGRANSIVRLEFDLALSSCSVTRTESANSLRPEIDCVVRNVGKDPASMFAVKLFLDANRDGLSQSDELVATLNSTSSLHPGDSTAVRYQWENAPAGESLILVDVDFPQDQRFSNNHSTAIIQTCYQAKSVIINEIMYDPLADQNEWIELYNRGTYPVDLKGWHVSDRPTASGSMNGFSVSSQSILLRPHTYCVLAADSTILSLFPHLWNLSPEDLLIILNQSGGLGLGNDGDAILLRDLTAAAIDSVSYTPQWHRHDVTDTKGRSLERLNPDLDSNLPGSWSTSVLLTGGTPGLKNSTFTTGVQSSASLTFSPNPFSPDGDGFEDFCLVQYRVPLSSAFIHIKVFDIKGRLVRILANSEISASQGELVWDGLDQNRQRVRIGPYIVLIQATDSNGRALTTIKGVVVVATRL